MRYLTPLVFVLMQLILTSCGVSGANRSPWDEVPQDLKVCFDKLVPKPSEVYLTKAETFNLIRSLKKSELKKSLCGKRLLAWIKAQG